MRRHTPRKKKLTGPRVVEKMKLVQVNEKTQIEVPAKMSDEDAIERFYAKHTELRNPDIHILTKTSENEDEADDTMLGLAGEETWLP